MAGIKSYELPDIATKIPETMVLKGYIFHGNRLVVSPSGNVRRIAKFTREVEEFFDTSISRSSLTSSTLSQGERR